MIKLERKNTVNTLVPSKSTNESFTDSEEEFILLFTFTRSLLQTDVHVLSSEQKDETPTLFCENTRIRELSLGRQIGS